MHPLVIGLGAARVGSALTRPAMQKGLGPYPFTAGTDGSLSGAVKNLLGNYPNANWNNGLHYFNTALVFYRRSDWQNAGISVTSAFAVSGVPVQLWQAQRANWNNGLHYFNTALVFYRRSDWQNAGISVTSAFAVSGVPVQLWQAQRAKWTQAQALSYLQVWKAAYSSWLARRSTVSR